MVSSARSCATWKSSTRRLSTDMTVKFQKFVAKAPTLEAVFLDEEHIDELAVWLGADGYTLEKVLQGNQQLVTFTKSIRLIDGKPVRTNSPDRIVRAYVGQWLVRYPRHVTENGSEREDYYFSITQEELDKFVIQQLETGEVDVPQPRSYI